jgi:uncharacterized protein
MIWAWALICFAVFLIGLTKSGLGAGLGLIVVPLTAIGLSHTDRGEAATLGLLLPLLIAGDLFSIYQYRKLADFSLVKSLLLPTLIGIVVGALLLSQIHKQNAELISILMRLEIGLESMLLCGLAIWREWKGLPQKLLPEPTRSWLTGTFIGVSTTLAHAAGPIFAAYLLPLKPSRQTFVGTASMFFFLANMTKVPVYIAAGQFAHAEIGFTVRFLPLVVLGAICGFYLVKKMTDLSYLRLVYYLTFLIGVYLVVESVVKLVAKMS